MKTILRSTFIAVLLGLIQVTARAEESLDKLKKQSDESVKVFKDAEPGLDKFFKQAVGYAVFPEVVKGGFILGGAHGEGLVYEGGKLVGRAKISQATLGAQVGGQVYREVVFFETAETLKKFKESRCEMDAQVSAVAAGSGASADAKYRDGVLVFTRAIKGLMADASIGGQKFKFEAIP